MVCDSFLSEISSGLIFNECSICDISDGFMKEHCNNSLVFVYLYLHEGYCLVIIKKKMIYYQRFCKVYLPFNLERIRIYCHREFWCSRVCGSCKCTSHVETTVNLMLM